MISLKETEAPCKTTCNYSWQKEGEECDLTKCSWWFHAFYHENSLEDLVPGWTQRRWRWSKMFHNCFQIWISGSKERKESLGWTLRPGYFLFHFHFSYTFAIIFDIVKKWWKSSVGEETYSIVIVKIQLIIPALDPLR